MKKVWGLFEIMDRRGSIMLGITGVLALIPFLYYKKNQKIARRSIIDIIGNTPLIYLPKLSQAAGSHIYVKLQYLNPFGSSKDRAMKQILMKENLMDQTEVVEASSGSTAISLVHISHMLNKKATIFLPNDLAEDKYRLLQILKAKIHKVPPVSIVDPNHYFNLARKHAENKDCFFTNQFQNLQNAKVHYETTGPEIYNQTNGLIHTFICSAGTGGTLAGVSQYLKGKNKDIRIVLADPQGSSLFNKVKFNLLFTNQEKQGQINRNPFYTIIQGVGLNRSTANFNEAIIDDAEKVSDLQSLHMAHYLIENQGLFVGGSSALNLVAAVKQARKHKDKNIVTIIHDNGIRYMKKFYCQAYLKEKKITFARKQWYDPNDLSFVG